MNTLEWHRLRRTEKKVRHLTRELIRLFIHFSSIQNRTDLQRIVLDFFILFWVNFHQITASCVSIDTNNTNVAKNQRLKA